MGVLNNKCIRKNEDDEDGRYIFIYRECLKFKIPKNYISKKNIKPNLNVNELKNFLDGLHLAVNNF